MNAAPRGVLDGGGAAVDVAFVGAGEAADDWPLDLGGDRLDGVEVARRGGGEACFDDVDAEALQLVGDF